MISELLSAVRARKARGLLICPMLLVALEAAWVAGGAPAPTPAQISRGAQLCDQADQLLATGKPAEALTLYQEVLAILPASPRAKAGLAKCRGRASAKSRPAVSHSVRTVAGVRMDVITADMSNPDLKVSVVLAQGFPGTDEGFGGLVSRSGATAAVAGTFFCKHSRIPIGDIVVDGQVRHMGRMATAMAITPGNHVSFGRVTRGRTADWTGYETVLEAGPTVLKNGQVDVRPSDEGFRDPHVLGAAVRTAAGLTADNRLLLVTIRRGVTLPKLGEVMKALGCLDAMNLDGGASLSMYYRGKVLIPAGRRLTNLLVVHERGRHVSLADPPRYHPDGNGGHPRVAARALPGEELTQAGLSPYPGARDGVLPGWADGPPVYTTSDGFDKVVEFYRGQLGDRAACRATRDGEQSTALLRLTSGAGEGALLQILQRKAGPTMFLVSIEGLAVPPDAFPE